MRNWVVVVINLLLVTASMGQGYPGSPQYSTSNKKAIKIYEGTAEFARTEDWDGALVNLDKALKADPNFAEAHLRKGDLYMQLDQMTDAVQSYKTGIQIGGPEFYSEYYHLGEVLMKMELYDDASRCFHTYLGLPRKHPVTEKKAALYMESCAFAKEAKNNPVPFDPINLGGAINSKHDEYFPTLTVDGQTMIYTRQFPDKASPEGKNEDFFISHKKDTSWQESTPLGGYFNSSMREGAPTISADGQMMVFTVCDANGDRVYGMGRRGYGSCDLFWTFKDGEKWVKPMNVGKNVNSTHFESQPCLSADGRKLFFIRGKRGEGATQKFNVMMTELGDQGWGFAQYIRGKVNSDFSESSVLIHPDGQTLYFASNGHPGMGGLDIFKSDLQSDGTWGEPLNLGYPINTSGDEHSIMVNGTGSVAYFASDRDGGLGGLDLYQFELPKNLRPIAVTYMKGKVFDKITKDPLSARFDLTDTETEELVVESFSNHHDGSFIVSLPTNKNYALNVALKGYMFYSETFQMSEKPFDGTAYHLDVPMTPITAAGDEALVLKNVFFETAQFDLKPTSRAELNKLATFLKLNETVKIELEGHTDNVGDETENQLLSENRAKSVVSYLKGRGVAEDRLTSVGYGESKPIADNSTVEGRAQNRRTQFRITSK